MTEKGIQIINKEEHQDEESLEQKIIFDNSIFEQIKGKELDLSVAKIFEIPTIRNWFKRQKEEYYVVSQREHIIDCKYTEGKAKIPIINKRIINKEIQDIKAKNPIKYVHLGGTEILIKACFREGIDTPIISAVKGNLIYQKFKFIISANYSVAINDRNIDKSLVLYWKMSGIELAPGSKIFTARCKNLYVLTAKHKITAKNKINKIKIENPFFGSFTPDVLGFSSMSTSSVFTSKFFVLSMFAKSSVYVSLVSECCSRSSSFISSTLISGRLSWLFSSFSSNSSCNCSFSLNLIISFANFVFCSFSFCLISYISFNIASSIILVFLLLLIVVLPFLLIVLFFQFLFFYLLLHFLYNK
ncbi:hypothetical protein MTR67_007271 [Solanum verrucosum]|uniref:Movement protein n=1 Tax=Solanum verrucosum TaxID=315347 RepID=A0AAF0Q4V1_SOLVR|nr:hypothetical protein MTR67_007271 [Solanum verrucosum]